MLFGIKLLATSQSFPCDSTVELSKRIEFFAIFENCYAT